MDKLQSYLNDIEGLLNSNNLNDCLEKIREIALEYNIDEDKVNEDFTSKFESKIKNDLISMQNQSVTRRKFNESKLINWIIKFVTDRKRAEDIINTLSINDVEPQIYTLKELFDLVERRPSTYYVDGMFRAGWYLIAGYAKSGKSLLLFNLSMSLVQGKPFLNRKTRQTNVLMIQNEEPLVGSGERLMNSHLQDFQLEQPELYEELIRSHRFILVKGYDIGIDLEKIFQIVDEYQIGAVFVDSLRASVAKSGLTETDSGTLALMYRFQSEIHKRDMLGVIIHHNNKGNVKDVDNPLKLIGGHNGLVGANDGNGILMLNKDKFYEGMKTVDFMLIPRNDNPFKLNFVYDEQEACRWDFKVLEDQTLSEDYLKMMREILVILQEYYDDWVENEMDNGEPIKGLTSNQIANAIGRDKKELIKCLNDLDKCGGINRDRKGKQWIYHIPYGGSPMYHLVEEMAKRNELIEKQNEVDRQFLLQILQCKTLKELEQLYSELDDDDKTRIREKRTIEHESHIFKLRHPQLFQVGDRVYCTHYFPTHEDIVAFGVRTVVRVELQPPAKGEKFDESCWVCYLNDLTEGVSQNLLTFESEYVKGLNIDKLEKIYNESPDENNV